jgi:hypothetical protein
MKKVINKKNTTDIYLHSSMKIPLNSPISNLSESKTSTIKTDIAA